MLKWLKEGIIKIENRGSDIALNKEDSAIIFVEEQNMKSRLYNPQELELFDMIYAASKEGILNDIYLRDWCIYNDDKILNWYKNVAKKERENLLNEGLISSQVVNKKTIFKATPALNEEAQRIAGLKKYLLEYTLIKDKETLEIELFEDYLIIAQVLGISEQTQKQFKELYPDMIQKTNFDSYDNVTSINYWATKLLKIANIEGIDAAIYNSASDYNNNWR